MHEMDVFKTAQNVNTHLGYFCKKIWLQEFSEIAQSGHMFVVQKLRLSST